ncbi:MAG: hypothetical protein KZQ79_17360, partial [Candidatus Thiodiazotropha sp. (ex Lucinoma borealis)]|nr:hypothetical protein [Candidatus Thiodiazotropha sp. (ex Lucinoma borealis)]
SGIEYKEEDQEAFECGFKHLKPQKLRNRVGRVGFIPSGTQLKQALLLNMIAFCGHNQII